MERDKLGSGFLSLLVLGPGLSLVLRDPSSWRVEASWSLFSASQELALKTLMKFVQLEGAKPLEKPQWESHYLFPRTLFRVRPWWDLEDCGGHCLRPSIP